MYLYCVHTRMIKTSIPKRRKNQKGSISMVALALRSALG